MIIKVNETYKLNCKRIDRFARNGRKQTIICKLGGELETLNDKGSRTPLLLIYTTSNFVYMTGKHPQ